MTECDHHGIVHEWGFDLKFNWGPTSWICKHCKEIRTERFPSETYMTMAEHNATCDGTCDHCKAQGIMINTGDANSEKGMSNRKWNAELNAYKAARAQGIQPSGTSMKKINEAVEISNKTGKAYGA